jgi:hypothetical protein
MVAVVIAAQVDFVIPAQAVIQSWRIVGSCGLTRGVNSGSPPSRG